MKKLIIYSIIIILLLQVVMPMGKLPTRYRVYPELDSKDTKFNTEDTKSWRKGSVEEWGNIPRNKMQSLDAVQAVKGASDEQIKSYWDKNRPLTSSKGGEVEIIKRLYPHLNKNIFKIEGSEVGDGYVKTSGKTIYFYDKEVEIGYTKAGLRGGNIILLEGDMIIDTDGKPLLQPGSSFKFLSSKGEPVLVQNLKAETKFLGVVNEKPECLLSCIAELRGERLKDGKWKQTNELWVISTGHDDEEDNEIESPQDYEIEIRTSDEAFDGINVNYEEDGIIRDAYEQQKSTGESMFGSVKVTLIQFGKEAAEFHFPPNDGAYVIEKKGSNIENLKTEFYQKYIGKDSEVHNWGSILINGKREYVVDDTILGKWADSRIKVSYNQIGGGASQISIKLPHVIKKTSSDVTEQYIIIKDENGNEIDRIKVDQTSLGNEFIYGLDIKKEGSIELVEVLKDDRELSSKLLEWEDEKIIDYSDKADSLLLNPDYHDRRNQEIEDRHYFLKDLSAKYFPENPGRIFDILNHFYTPTEDDKDKMQQLYEEAAELYKQGEGNYFVAELMIKFWSENKIPVDKDVYKIALSQTEGNNDKYYLASLAGEKDAAREFMKQEFKDNKNGVNNGLQINHDMFTNNFLALSNFPRGYKGFRSLDEQAELTEMMMPEIKKTIQEMKELAVSDEEKKDVYYSAINFGLPIEEEYVKSTLNVIANDPKASIYRKWEPLKRITEDHPSLRTYAETQLKSAADTNQELAEVHRILGDESNSQIYASHAIDDFTRKKDIYSGKDYIMRYLRATESDQRETFIKENSDQLGDYIDMIVEEAPDDVYKTTHYKFILGFIEDIPESTKKHHNTMVTSFLKHGYIREAEYVAKNSGDQKLVEMVEEQKKKWGMK